MNRFHVNLRLLKYKTVDPTDEVKCGEKQKLKVTLEAQPCVSLL